jgi:hypothetical protein
MIWKRIRAALLAGAFVAATGLVMAEDKAAADKPADKPAPAQPAAKPATCTVWVDEWVEEKVPCKRITYKTEERQEKYTAYKEECVPEQRTRTVMHYRTVTETVMEKRTVCVKVPCVEERTVMKAHTVCKPVTRIQRKMEDHGHYECREVPCGPTLCDRIRKHFHRKKDCCDPCDPCCAAECEPVRMKTVKVWVPKMVCVEKAVTCMERVTECRPETIKVTVCKTEMRTEEVPVCRTRCIPECKTETCAVMVKKCTPYEAVRTVKVCVPHEEIVTVTRRVCKKVAKEVPVVECAAPCCPPPCCEMKCCGKRRFCHR